MTDRSTITPAGLAGLPDDMPVSIIGSRGGYAVLVGRADRPRWLHTTSGKFSLFQSVDRAAAVLHTAGIYRFQIDITAGRPQ